MYAHILSHFHCGMKYPCTSFWSLAFTFARANSVKVLPSRTRRKSAWSGLELITAAKTTPVNTVNQQVVKNKSLSFSFSL